MQIKRLAALALVGLLPIACGTETPMGLDTSVLDAASATPGKARTPATSHRCNAVAAEIIILRGSEPDPLQQESVLLQVAMLNETGLEILDGSCQGVKWSLETGRRLAADTIITVGVDSRFASVFGLAGTYRVRATAPNGLSAATGITLR